MLLDIIFFCLDDNLLLRQLLFRAEVVEYWYTVWDVRKSDYIWDKQPGRTARERFAFVVVEDETGERKFWMDYNGHLVDVKMGENALEMEQSSVVDVNRPTRDQNYLQHAALNDNYSNNKWA